MPFVPRVERSSIAGLSLGSRRILLGSLLLTLLLAAPTIYGGPVGGPFSIASPPSLAPHGVPSPSGAPVSTAPFARAPQPALSLGLGLLGLPGTASTTAMAFDAKDGYTLLIAPNTSAAATAASASETYAYVGGDWVRLHPTTAPSSREYASMTYDARLGKIVLFGGYSFSGSFLGDTWEFSGGSWTDVSALSNQTPSARSAAALAFDPSGGFDLLFGGYGSLGSALFGNLTDTWEFQGGNWSTVSSPAVPPIEGSMAYDANLSEMIYYGGVGLLGLCTRSTFAFSGGQWTDISSTITGAPAGLAMTSMAYDAGQSRLLLFGGACGLGVAGIGLTLATSNATYALSGGAWTRLSVAGAPAPRFGVDLAYDARLGSTILFGGENATLLVLGS
ncbi:MAG TPA: kelch repeat-containing protein, partial [Thermoplasmata archaeon]|nr:kelch repeat-containing protein [Thermoplasmata archaeon]